jgi:hypothetical protein
VIEKGLATFIEVGRALERIRDQRLYRESHNTFEDYCKDRWGITRAHAYRQIEAAQITKQLVSPNGGHADDEQPQLREARVTCPDILPPASERVARELAPLKDQPEKLHEAWKEAVEQHGPKPTAKQVGEVVDRLRPDPAVSPRQDDDGEPEGEALAGFLKEEIPEAISALVDALKRPAEAGAIGGLLSLLDEASKLDLDLDFVDLSDLVQARQEIDELIQRIEQRKGQEP